MFRELNIVPGDFNVIIEPITSLETTKSDNGYFLVKGIWGTCFHRIATKKDRFEIIANRLPKCAHTYTKIPSYIADRTFFVYVNFTESFKIIMPAGGVVVGFSEAQRHISKPEWLSVSCLVYSPTGERPIPVSVETPHKFDELVVVDKETQKDSIVTIETITDGYPIKYLRPYVPATQDLSHLLDGLKLVEP